MRVPHSASARHGPSRDGAFPNCGSGIIGLMDKGSRTSQRRVPSDKLYGLEPTMSFLDLVHARYSCRAFTDEPVTDDELAKLLEAVRFAPTAKNAQPVRVWVFRSDEALAKIRACTSCHFGAPLLVLFGADAGAEGVFVRPSDGQNAALGDATIVAAHYMLEAKDLGLDTTWVGFFDTGKINEAFPQTVGYDLVGLFPTGHADPEKGGPTPRHTQRKELAEFVQEL